MPLILTLAGCFFWRGGINEKGGGFGLENIVLSECAEVSLTYVKNDTAFFSPRRFPAIFRPRKFKNF